MKEVLSPNQREDNPKARVSPVTAGSEGSLWREPGGQAGRDSSGAQIRILRAKSGAAGGDTEARQQALLDVLQPIFAPGFHPSSYGYWPGRSCHQAVAKAERFLEIACEILEGELELVVDRDKTHITSVYEGVPCLGFIIYHKKLAKFKETVRKLTPRKHGMSVEQIVKRLNQFRRGRSN